MTQRHDYTKRIYYINRIYEYLDRCIHFQYYSYGDVLPSVESLCVMFTASDQTVKAALHRLCEEHYLTMQKGRRAKVIYQQSDSQRDEYITRFLCERWPAYREIFQVSEIVFRAIIIEGFKRFDEEGYETLSFFAEQGDLNNLIRFYCCILQKVKNPLIMNLFWEIAVFSGLPFLGKHTSKNYKAQEVAQRLHAFINLGKSGQWDRLDAELLEFWREITGSILKSIEPYIQPVPADEQVPFSWRIYRGQPQICYSLAIHIIHEIFQGRYQMNQFLPSYQKMSEEYNVSVNTVRRTVHLLNQLGVAQTINGKGTRVFSLGEPLNRPDYTVPAIRRNLALMSRSFELLSYSCEMASYTILSSMSREERMELIEQLKIFICNGNCGFAPWQLLRTFSTQAPMQTLREIYTKLYGLALWGYPLKETRGEFANFKDTLYKLTESMVEHLQNEQFEQCAVDFKEYAVKEHFAIQEHLVSLGIEMEERIIPLSIQFYEKN